ncbi:MAG TPA: HAMP domain-containing sensor histidine kinase [Gaiellaceae bacterium]|nr:HAMP domain-containing sensor histidine kinase [Gaiellaceae bacterium]
MRDVVEIAQYVNLGLYTVVAIAAVWLWRRHREQAGLWAALAFVALALIVDVGPLLPDDPATSAEKLALKILIAGLALFPYLLYRFAVSFKPPGRALSLAIGGITLIVLAWTFTLSDVPGEGDEWPTSFAIYVAAFTTHWTFLTIVVTYRLWMAGRGEASVPRKRMRLLALASATITLSLLISVAGGTSGSVSSLVATLLSSVSALTFLVGLAPPSILRATWRRPETTRLQGAIAELMGATSRAEVVGHVLPPMAEIVGAQAIELQDRERAVLGSWGNAADDADRIVAVDTPAGEVKLWTSAYTPFFGAEELAVVRTLAALTALALDRARLFAHERETREALERADKIKTNFVSLAAHELRTPVATIHGLVETLHARRDELATGQIEELESVLRGQTTRMKSLVEQLLDLSRLEADAVEIHPTPLAIRPRVEEIVVASLGKDASLVEIDVDSRLVAQVDPHAFDRIVSNLVVNACRYGSAPVRVSAEQNDRHFRVTVEDRGDGVPPEFVPDLFERFTRSSGSPSRTGSGLGLAIARSYAQAHRGDLFYEQAQPHGARFQLVLPIR